MNAADLWHQMASNPWLLAYGLGVISGWTMARRATRYMLGGRLR
jgi:hypothetical protein